MSSYFAFSGRRNWRFFAVHWKADLKMGFAGTGFKFNFTSMTVADDAIADNQAKAGAGSDGFGGEERFEQVRLHFRRNAGAIVHDFHDDLIVFQRSADADFACAID